jgi:hypothetical protein
MKYLKLASVFLAATIGGISSAIAGVSGAVTTTVEPLSGTVTYRTTGAKGLATKVGYKVTISRSGTNTVNNVVFKGNTSVFKSATPEEENTNESAEFDEANDDGGFCGVGAVPTEVVCNFGQMRAGDSRTFAVFFKGPVESAGNCFTPGGDPCEVVRFRGTTDYSEGGNDSPGSTPNDQAAWVWVGSDDVPLGTPNPTNVKSALSKSGGDFFTGIAGEPSALTFPFAVKLSAPNPTVFSSVSLNLKKLSLGSEVPDEVAAAQDCMTAGNFNNCYQADVRLPGVTYLPGPDYLTIILLIDSTEVKNPFRSANIKVYDGSDGYVNPLPPCASGGLPPAGELRCVAEIDRYGNAGSLGELRRDVRVVLHALANGPFRTR